MTDTPLSVSPPPDPRRDRYAATLTRRRFTLAGLALYTYATLVVMLGTLLASGGMALVEFLFFVCVAVVLPPYVLNFWHSWIGLWVRLTARDPVAAVMPYAAAGEGTGPLKTSTAIAMTLRNEDPARALARMKAIRASVEKTGHGRHFTWYLLSDTNQPAIAAMEETMVAEWRAMVDDADRIVYRRRAENRGFKAGNIRDFMDRFGDRHDFLLPLDADSLMAGDLIVRLVRILEAEPRIGIVQTLFSGLPTISPFGRIFQYGVVAATRPVIRGFLWYYGDAATFWGHNALLRIAPFAAHGDLPEIPGKPPVGGPILSHDLVESWLLRGAGHEILVLPNTTGSWEDAPPNLSEYLRREARWAQGTAQYWWLFGLEGITAFAKFQMWTVVVFFAGMLLWTLALALSPLVAIAAVSDPGFNTGLALTLWLIFLLFILSPRITGVIELIATRGAVRRLGGIGRVLAGSVIETVFHFMLTAISNLRVSVLLVGLPFGRMVTWSGQNRDAHRIGWDEALRDHWKPMLFGVLIASGLFMVSPWLLLAAFPVLAGHLFAIPFAVVTADPELGVWLKARSLVAVPEEYDLPPEVAAIQPVLPT
jgi:membrane glycosyltransferase